MTASVPCVQAGGLTPLGREAAAPWEPRGAEWPLEGTDASGSPIQPPVGCMQGGGPGSHHGAGTQLQTTSQLMRTHVLPGNQMTF